MNGHAETDQDAFTIPLSVNKALTRMGELAGTYVYVNGLLAWQFENQSLAHWPRAEARGYGFWLEPFGPTYSFEAEVLTRWHDKRVVVGGQLMLPPMPSGYREGSVVDGRVGCGHMGLWAAELRVTSLILWKAWQRAHPEPV